MSVNTLTINLNELDKDLDISLKEDEERKILLLGEAKFKLIFSLAKRAKLELNMAFLDLDNVTNIEVFQDEGSISNIALADFSKGKVDFKMINHLRGQYSSTHFHLASLAKLKDNKTFEINISHENKDTYSLMECYGVSLDSSSLTFTGFSDIKKYSKRSSAHQKAKIMVFDENTNCKASPSLLIDENDVEASHAATVGQINPEHIYYLMTRGLKEEEAKSLITLGYLNPIIKYFDDELVISRIRKNIEEGV